MQPYRNSRGYQKKNITSAETVQCKYFSLSAWTSRARNGQLRQGASSALRRSLSSPARSRASLISHPHRLYSRRMFGWINTDSRRERTMR